MSKGRIERGVTVIRSGAPAETLVGTEIVLMSLQSGQCLGLGETGSEVWRLLAEPTTLDSLVAKLSSEYQAPDGVIEEDVRHLLEEMLERGLIDIR